MVKLRYNCLINPLKTEGEVDVLFWGEREFQSAAAVRI